MFCNYKCSINEDVWRLVYCHRVSFLGTEVSSSVPLPAKKRILFLFMAASVPQCACTFSLSSLSLLGILVDSVSLLL